MPLLTDQNEETSLLTPDVDELKEEQIDLEQVTPEVDAGRLSVMQHGEINTETVAGIVADPNIAEKGSVELQHKSIKANKARRLQEVEAAIIAGRDPALIAQEYSSDELMDMYTSKSEQFIDAEVDDPEEAANIKLTQATGKLDDLTGAVRDAIDRNDAVSFSFGTGMDILEFFVPLNYSLSANNSIRSWEGWDASNATGLTNVTEEESINVVLNDIYLNTPFEERQAKLLSFLEHIENDPDLNGIEREMMYFTMLDPDRWWDEDAQNFWVGAGAAINAVDAFAVAKAVKGLGRGVQGWSTARRLAKSADDSENLAVINAKNADVAASQLAKAKNGDVEMQKALGLSDEQLANSAMPKVISEAPETKMLDGIEEFTEQSAAYAAALTPPRSAAESLVSQAGIEQGFQKILKQAQVQRMDKSINVANSTYRVSDDATSIDLSIRIGTDKTGRAFASEKAANAAIARRGYTGGVAEQGASGGWYVRMDNKVPIDPLDDLANLSFKDVKGKAGWGGYFRSFSSTMDNSVRELGNAAVNAEQRMKADLIKIVDADYLKADEATRINANYLLKRGEEIGEEFSDITLSGMVGVDGKAITVAEAKAYRAARVFWNKMHTIENDALRKSLLREGYLSTITHKGNMAPVKFLDDFGKINKGGTGSFKIDKSDKILDMATGKVLKLSNAKNRAHIESLYAKGYRLGKTKVPLVEGRNEYRVMLVPARTIAKDVSLLPTNVLKKRPGYVSRYHKGAHFVRARSVSAGGDVSLQALGNFRTKQQALDWISAERAAGRLKGMDVEPTFDNSLLAALRQNEGISDPNVYHIDDMMFYQSRSSKFHVSDPDLIANPMEALQRSLGTVSRQTSIDDAVKTLEAKFLKEFSHVLDPSLKGKFPKTIDGILASDPTKTSDLAVEQAKQVFKYMEALRGTGTSLDARMRVYMIRMGDDLINKGGLSEGLGRAVQKQAQEGRSLGGVLKNVAFTYQIALNPVRQFVIQGQQRLFLTGVDPAVQAKTLASGYHVGAEAALRRFGKGFEARKPTVPLSSRNQMILERFEKAGLNELNANIQLDEVAKFGVPGSNVFNKPVEFMRRIGFESGEVVNLGATFTFAAHKHAKTLGKPLAKLTEKEWGQVAHMTREYSFNMTRMDNFGYQEGLLSVTSQYLAVRHKALMASVPQRFGGSKVFTGREKMRMAAFNLLTYGAEGVGIYALVNKLMADSDLQISDVELDDGTILPAEYVSNMIRGGLMDFAVNATVDAMFNADAWSKGTDAEDDFQLSQASVSGSFSALANIDELALALYDATPLSDAERIQSKSVLETALGPSGSVLGDIGRLTGKIGFITGVKDWSTAEKVDATVNEMVRIVPAIRNALILTEQADPIDTQLGQTLYEFSTKKGVLINVGTDGEAILKAVAGIQPSATSAYYRTKDADARAKADINGNVDRIVKYYYEAVGDGRHDDAENWLNSWYNIIADHYEEPDARHALKRLHRGITVDRTPRDQAIAEQALQDAAFNSSQMQRVMNTPAVLKNRKLHALLQELQAAQINLETEKANANNEEEDE